MKIDKTVLLGCVVSLFCWIPSAQSKPKQQIRYVNARQLTLINRAEETTPSFQRLDVERYPQLSSIVNRYYRYATGLALRFRTNSSQIWAKWSTVNKSSGNNATLIMQRGLDLYIQKEGSWVFAGVARPKHTTEHESLMVSNMDSSMKECMVYLPLHDEVTNLEIGIDSLAMLEAAPSTFRHKIVVVGSSITHGTSASRPGMAYPARLGRMFNIEFVNLGASGQCKVDRFFADVIASIQADAFILDLFSNPSAKQIEERLDEFILTIRKAHPTLPLIFLQTEIRESSNFNLKIRAIEEQKRATAQRLMKKYTAKDKHIYFIKTPLELGDDHEATVDGVHPSDLGFERILQQLYPQLNKIFKRYNLH